MTDTQPCNYPDCGLLIAQAAAGWVHLDTHGLPTGHTPVPVDPRFTLIERIARQVRDHASQYTRAYGREDNSARVLELTDSDMYALGERILTVIKTGTDTGDSRYACGVHACTLWQGHSVPHNPKDDDGRS